MVEDGKITAEEAMNLIKALEETPAEDELKLLKRKQAQSGERSAGPEFEEIKARAKRFAMFPLWIGVGFTVLGAYWMFALVQNANYGFWFFCAWFPLLLGLSGDRSFGWWNEFALVVRQCGSAQGRVAAAHYVGLSNPAGNNRLDACETLDILSVEWIGTMLMKF